jgi:phospholipid N-methyltransferase
MTVGAVAPSSLYLAEEILQGIGLSEASVIVEYGPGTGVFTQKILAKKNDGARLIAVEKNPKFAAHIRYRFPTIELLEGCVTDLPATLARMRIDHADCVVSGLPWAAFSGEEQVRLLKATESVLRPGGHFVTLAYVHGLVLPEARRFRERLRQQFRIVRTSRVIWRNLPPAFVYRCVR